MTQHQTSKTAPAPSPSSLTLPIQAVLFDLDGTLVDTAPDLIAALDCALQEAGLPCCNAKFMRPAASHGSLAMVKAACPDMPTATQQALQQRMLHWYNTVNGQHAQLFAGMETLLTFLRSRQIPIGVITNKPARFTRPLLQRMGLLPLMRCVISGDSCTRNKPAPAPMLLAAQQCNIAPQSVLYLGDAERDLLAAQAVGMQGGVAHWGYIGPQDHPENWPSTIMLANPAQLTLLL